MASRADLLREEVRRAREDLARDLAALRREGAAAARRALTLAAVAGGAVVAVRVVRRTVRRVRS